MPTLGKLYNFMCTSIALITDGIEPPGIANNGVKVVRPASEILLIHFLRSAAAAGVRMQPPSPKLRSWLPGSLCDLSRL